MEIFYINLRKKIKAVKFSLKQHLQRLTQVTLHILTKLIPQYVVWMQREQRIDHFKIINPKGRKSFVIINRKGTTSLSQYLQEAISMKYISKSTVGNSIEEQ